MPTKQTLVRVWKTGKCKFTKVSVNEYPIVKGKLSHVKGELEHFDSPSFEHWINKQNNYSTREAINLFENQPLSDKPNLFGTYFQKRMWFKKNFFRIPFFYLFYFLYIYLICGAWKAGRVGIYWSKSRITYLKMIEIKLFEMNITDKVPPKCNNKLGQVDRRVVQF